MPSTYTPIATTTLGSAASSVTFSSISGTYTDLILVLSGTAGSLVGTFLQFNSDTGSNYSGTYIYGDGSSASSGRVSNQTSAQIGNVQTTTVSNQIVQIMNYSNSTTNKTLLSRVNNTSNGSGAWVGLWRSTAAINAVKILVNSSSFDAGSTFTLYGVKSA